MNGELRQGATGKDVIITLCGFFNNDEVLNHVVEFAGDGIAGLSISDRLAIANMTTEWGTLAGLFPCDGETIGWLQTRAAFIERRGLAGVPSDVDGNGEHPRLNQAALEKLRSESLKADDNAFYSKHLELNLATVSPHVSGPNHVKTATPVVEMRERKLKINKAYLVSCVNSREEDLRAAARVLKGKKVAEGVDFYIAAASSEVQAASEKNGDWQALVDSGAKVLPPGCGPCIGLGTGLLEDGEVGISATNRNFKGRMGSRNAEAYLGSPEVVAASVAAGYIEMPYPEEARKVEGSITVNTSKKTAGSKVRVLDGFPGTISGEIVFCHQDNLNTDGIFPGKYTYIDDFTPQQQAEVVMENYDPKFGKLVGKGDILVGGFNFGTGSSREQAATALKYRGIRLVIAGSFSQTYKRNALNNGFLTIECPELVNDLKSRIGTDKLTVKTGIKAIVDFSKAELVIGDKSYTLSPVGEAAQELVICGGLENWVKERL